MSDFIYSSIPKPQGELTRYIQGIYHTDAPFITEWHGEWGSLAVSRNLYNGFQPLETDKHIFVVIGGPVLCFQDNMFLMGNDSVAGTRAVYEHWQQSDIHWDEDLSGPFVALLVDKQNRKVSCVTDLMMFIPVYCYEQLGELMLGTHVDALASAADQIDVMDTVSLVDFVLNSVITYPFTAYANIRQCHPAAVQEFELNEQCIVVKQTEVYWLPKETYPYSDINQAALALREGLQEYVESITVAMNEVAQFISAGEDSRALAGLLPQRLKRDAFIFLDNMNREGHIAKKAAEAYGANFNVKIRSYTHYLDILPEASDLIGTGHQYVHAHSLGFHKICNLDKYSAVFGGYLSDSLLKAAYALKFSGPGCTFIPEFFISGETQSKPLNSTLFNTEILKVITQRRRQHLQKVQAFRKQTAHEWFVLWPATMRLAIPNLYSNRRLFRSYEPFMANQAVKISAAVPTSWKLNRRLFNKAVCPFLKPTRYLPHADGHLPYYPWWVNSPIRFAVRVNRYISKRIGLIKGNQGPWGDWNQIINSKAWKDAIDKNQAGFDALKLAFYKTQIEKVFEEDQLNLTQKINLLQMLYSCKRQ